MNTTKHEGFTPWPWIIDHRASTRVKDAADTTIASAGMASRYLEEAQANARLIADAPNLLAQLEAVTAERDALKAASIRDQREIEIERATSKLLSEVAAMDEEGCTEEGDALSIESCVRTKVTAEWEAAHEKGEL